MAARKNTQKKDATEEVANAPLGSVNNHAGVVVSLNMKSAAYFGVGEPGETPKLWLDQDRWSAAIPGDLTAEEADVVSKALKAGTIMSGRKWLPAVTKVLGTKEIYTAFLNGPLKKEVREKFVNLVKKESEGGYTALEILTECMDKERRSRSRMEWLGFLQEAIDHYQGPVQLVQDFEHDPDNYEVKIDPSSMIVEDDSRGDVKKDPLKIPVDAIGEGFQKAEEKDLDAFLGN